MKTMKQISAITMLALLFSALTACGGGGGSATPGKAWGTAVLIETDDAGGARSPQIAIDASGNAIAVWEQSDGARLNIWANRYTAGSGWGTAALIETDNTGNALGPQIAFDASGNAIAVWRQFATVSDSIYANRYNVTTGLWGPATLIETGTGFASSPQIAVDADGNAIAVWVQDGDPTSAIRYDIYANRYNVTTGLWGPATLIETDNTGNAFYPQIAVDASGNAMAVWRQDGDPTGGVRNDIWANRYNVTTGIWGTPTRIETDDAGGADSPQIAIDASGNAIVVWRQSDGARDNIYANRYTAGSGWGTATLIENNDQGNANFPQIAIDVSGNAIAVWEQSDGTRYNIWANRYQ